MDTQGSDRTRRPVPTPEGDGGCATVYFDGACPLCSREIATYRRMDGADSLRWVDITQVTAQELGGDLTREQALARFHVRDEQGRLVSGAAGFVTIWRRLPGLRWLAWLAARPPLKWLLEPAYRVFLRFRPWLTRSVVRAATTDATGAPER